jgi:hypothetical protein
MRSAASLSVGAVAGSLLQDPRRAVEHELPRERRGSQPDGCGRPGQSRVVVPAQADAHLGRRPAGGTAARRGRQADAAGDSVLRLEVPEEARVELTEWIILLGESRAGVVIGHERVRKQGAGGRRCSSWRSDRP